MKKLNITEQIVERGSLPKVRFAGFWMRFWAFLLDGLVIFGLNRLFAFLFLQWLNIENGLLLSLIALTIGFLYFVLMTKKLGQTLGKMVFGLKVIPTSGDSLSWGSVIFREVVGRYLYQAFWFLACLYLFVPFTKKKQGIHDYIADTYVVHEESDENNQFN